MSTLSQANRKRDIKMFALPYTKLYLHCKTNLRGNFPDIGGEVDPGKAEVFVSTIDYSF